MKIPNGSNGECTPHGTCWTIPVTLRRTVRPWLLSGEKGERWKISPAKFPSRDGFIAVDQRDRTSERIVISERIVRARAEGFTWRNDSPSVCPLEIFGLVDVRFSVVSRGKQWKSGVGRQLWKSCDIDPRPRRSWVRINWLSARVRSKRLEVNFRIYLWARVRGGAFTVPRGKE